MLKGFNLKMFNLARSEGSHIAVDDDSSTIKNLFGSKS